MFEDLKTNIEHEKKILLDMVSIQNYVKANPAGANSYSLSLNALIHQLALLNNAVPDLLKAENKGMGVREGSVSNNIVKMSYISPSTQEKKYISINK